MKLRILLPFVVVVLFALILPSLSPLAQADDNWLPVPPEDLALKDNPASPGSNAMILYRESTLNAKYADTDGDYVEEYVRIKIFNQQGVQDEGDVEIPFFKEYSNIKDIRARTIEPDGSIVEFQGKTFEKSIVKASGIKFLAKTFTLPEVRPGCIIEYKYRLQFQPHYLHDMDWTVSSELYTRDARFTIIPYAESDYPLVYRQLGLPKGAAPAKQPDGSYTMLVHDFPGIVDEPLMLPRRTLEARVEFYYRNTDDPSSETTEHYWNRIGKKWNDNLEHFIDKKKTLAEEVVRITSPGDSPDTKLRKINARVQQIKNLSMEAEKTEKEEKEEGIKTNSNVDDVLKRGYANPRQINFLFVGLVRAAGFDATEVYLAPRNTNFFYPSMQDSDQIANDDIVWVNAGGKEYYLDPAANYYPFGVLPWYETATQGLRVKKQGGDIISVPPAIPSNASVSRTADLHLDVNGQASGTVQADFTGQQAAQLREENRKADETGRKKVVEDEIRGWLPVGSVFNLTKLDHWEDPSVPLHAEGTVKIGTVGSIVGHRMLVPASIFGVIYAGDFVSETRSNAIYFSYPSEHSDDVKWEGPDGYNVETVPAAVPETQQVISYGLSSSQQGGTAEVKTRLVIKEIGFDKKYYPALRSFFNTVKSDDSAQIVFDSSVTAKNK
ncbi:MAG: DUF3857 domain-containing protein [Candidatus Acidiferrales bacterium]